MSQRNTGGAGGAGGAGADPTGGSNDHDEDNNAGWRRAVHKFFQYFRKGKTALKRSVSNEQSIPEVEGDSRGGSRIAVVLPVSMLATSV